MKSTKLIFLIAVSCFAHKTVFPQASVLGNNPQGAGDYLGWDINTNQDLEIRHDGPQPIIFSTNMFERMRLNQSGQLLVGTTTPVYPGNTRLEVLASGAGERGITATAAGPTGLNIGGYFQGTGGTVALGVRGEAIAPSTIRNIGVYGEACNAPINYGVYGQACDEGDSWAGYFVGKTFSSSGAWDASDAQLKTNVNPIENATELLMAINPKSYEFLQDIPGFPLPDGLQYGVIAQELAQVVPHAVTPFTAPPVLDEEGNITHSSEQYQGVNYTQLIPLLVAGFKEQQAQQASYSAQYAQTLNTLAEVQAMMKNLDQQTSAKATRLPQIATLRQNAPNPFTNQTEINFEVTTAGEVTLEIVDASGRSLEVLTRGPQEQGTYRVTWDASRYASGTYYGILRTDGQMETIKLIKK